MNKCFKCGFDIAKDDEFCEKCGSRLKCLHCGEKIKEETEYCQKCGTKVNIKANGNKKKKIILIVIFSLILFVGIIVSILLLTRKEKYKLEPEEVEAYIALNAATRRIGVDYTYTYEGHTYTIERPRIYKKDIDVLGNLMKKFGNEWFEKSDFRYSKFYGTVYSGGSTIETELCTEFKCAKFIVDPDDWDYYLISCDFRSNTYKTGVLTTEDNIVDVYYVND